MVISNPGLGVVFVLLSSPSGSADNVGTKQWEALILERKFTTFCRVRQNHENRNNNNPPTFCDIYLFGLKLSCNNFQSNRSLIHFSAYSASWIKINKTLKITSFTHSSFPKFKCMIVSIASNLIHERPQLSESSCN